MVRTFRDWVIGQLARTDLTPKERAYLERLLARMDDPRAIPDP